MSKIARLASIVERAEKQALVLFIKESKQNDNTAVAMLKKRGVPEPEKVLELLKEITVDICGWWISQERNTIVI